MESWPIPSPFSASKRGRWQLSSKRWSWLVHSPLRRHDLWPYVWLCQGPDERVQKSWEPSLYKDWCSIYGRGRGWWPMTSASNQQLYLYQSATAPTSNITIGVWGVASAAAFFIVTKHDTVNDTDNIDIASCYQRGSWPWKTLVLEITGSGTGWRSEQHFSGGRYEQRLDYKFVKEKRGLQQERLNLHRRWSNQLSWIKTWKSGSQSKFEIAHPPRWGLVGVEMQFG